VVFDGGGGGGGVLHYRKEEHNQYCRVECQCGCSSVKVGSAFRPMFMIYEMTHCSTIVRGLNEPCPFGSLHSVLQRRPIHPSP
jgi:hypothetical protein